MSFFGRSVPLKYVILAAIAAVVFTGMFVHELQNRSDSMARYGPALPAKVINADEPKTVGSILGLGGSTYTNTRIRVTPHSGQPAYYSDVPLNGKVVVGQELKAWFYDGDRDSAYFENRFNTDSHVSNATPWLSVEDLFVIPIGVTILATVVAFIILRVLSRKKTRKRGRSAGSRRKSKAA